ncbi:hypothetical protein DCAR_0520302 [Daucus carota subsp. sativus]|uniref:ABC transporter domain-containing protein n=1 Tax=Daucus carota subsp. sativus TaxID=79200 RepID=A0AAF0X342_DAUCS|nr:hypothetical protein DCAR_0520302 [Daucus carota subsp. sativus]
MIDDCWNFLDLIFNAYVFFDGLCKRSILNIYKCTLIFLLVMYKLKIKVNEFLQGTVVDNIQYGPQLRGKKLSDSEVHKMLKLADLETLANEPEVLLLDEPTSALDPISTPNIEDVLVKLKTNQEMTIIMVSHSIKQIQRVVDVKWNGLHWSIISFTARVVLKHVIGFYDLNVS